MSEDRYVLNLGAAKELATRNAEAIAGAATSTTGCIDVGIQGIKRVAVNALSLSGVDGVRADATQHICRSAHWLQVVGVDATPVSAEVIQGQPYGDVAAQEPPCNPVGWLRRAFNVDPAVALIQRSGPQPAGGRPENLRFPSRAKSVTSRARHGFILPQAAL